MIPVTKPFLPPIKEYQQYVSDIWQRQWLTNNGPLVIELEAKLKEYLQVPDLLYLANGTIALQIAIQALGLKGEIITTPFSYIATTSSIVWEGCEPVFVDIDKDSFNIDAKKIEAAITPRTTGILATHVYGNPCDIDTIDSIAKKHNLKVIYDAAHCFGTKYKGKSVFEFGDISTTSFHATKLFHTIEGGAVFAKDEALLKKMAFMRNFGHNGPEDFAEVGINGKNSEFHAAMGLVNLNHVDAIIAKRKELCERYDQWVGKSDITKPLLSKDAVFNYAYYPVVFNSEETLLRIVNRLAQNEVFGRRYFHPSLHTLKYVKFQDVPVTASICIRVLCLPLYFDLTLDEVDFIGNLISQ